jgi:Flp pilus assembly protein TadD
MRHRRNKIVETPEPLEGKLSRARRCRRRGEERRAMLLLREACFEQSDDARLWTLYGVQCARLGRRDDAIHALGQARWLRERARDTRRAAVTHALLERVLQGERIAA